LKQETPSITQDRATGPQNRRKVLLAIMHPTEVRINDVDR
jgi:hypothetical protein